MKRIALAMFASISLLRGQQPVTAYIHSEVNIPASHLFIAEGRASAVFTSAGVQIKWRNGEPSPEVLATRQVVAVRLIAARPADKDPTALAAALPYEGVHVTIY